MVATRTFALCALAAAAASAAGVKRQDDDDIQCAQLCTSVATDANDQIDNFAFCTNQTWVNNYRSCLDCIDDGEQQDEFNAPGTIEESVRQLFDSGCNAQASVTETAPASTTSPTTTSGPAVAPAQVTECHTHDDNLYCLVDGDDGEWEVVDGLDDDEVENAPDTFTGCRYDGGNQGELICQKADGGSIELNRNDERDDDDSSSSSSTTITGVPTPTVTPTGDAAASISSDVSSAINSATSAAATPTGAASSVDAAAPVSFMAFVLAVFAL